MVETILSTIADVATQFGAVLTGVVQSAAALFYTPGAEGANGELTFVGVLLIIAVGSGLLFWAINLIRGLITRIGKR